jgi:phosphatidylserine decarboxylase
MTVRRLVARLLQQETLNFALTNRVPRRLVTRFMGWFSKLEHPVIRDISIAVWRFFCDVDLREARKTKFTSLHDCFIRELKEGSRPLDRDPGTLVSPCDAIVGACGAICGSELMQVKGSAYELEDLLQDRELAVSYRDGSYVTLRLTAGMYHRFHAPCDCLVQQITHIWGDAWNVNPVALRRVERLYCKNERVVIRTALRTTDHLITLVPVAAILVAGIRLRFLELIVDPRRCSSPPIRCRVVLRKGQEMGWFEHGSTVIVLAPEGFVVPANVHAGASIRMGEALMRLSTT